MSLTKQLWLAIIAIILLCLGGSFILNTYSAKSYFETQLFEKNIDGANNLALILSSQPFNPTFAELQINSQFDSGFYQHITLSAPQGGVIVEKISDSSLYNVPNWFVQLIDISPEPGVAMVSSGWRQIGELSVQSNTAFAYQELWRSTVRLLVYFAITAIVCGVLGHALLKHVTQPLADVVQQAKAIGERRFISTEVPKTEEFRDLVLSMNALSERVQNMLLAEAERIQGRLAESSRDTATQLLRREAFLSQAKASLSRDDHAASGGVILYHLDNLGELNSLYGREALDTLIFRIGEILNQFLAENIGAIGGRLDGSKFMLLVPSTDQQAKLAEQVLHSLIAAIETAGMATDIIKGISCNYSAGEDFIGVLDKLEKALESVSLGTDKLPVRHITAHNKNLPTQLSEWQTRFIQAFSNNEFQLNLFPVIGKEKQLLHFEAPIRLQYNTEQLLNAGDFLGWAQRAGIMADLDTRALALACAWLAQQPNDIGINISPQLLSNSIARKAFLTLLEEHKELAPRVWLEFPEQGVYYFIDEFKLFAAALKPLGCHLGIEHAGHAVGKIGLLHDVGLDYIKIDSAFIHEIQQENSTQVFLQGLVTITHSIGLTIIAEGVSTENEASCLWELGFDGMTGPAVEFNN